MAYYLLSFPGEAMDLTPDEMVEVGRTAHAAVDDMRAAGVFVFAGGIDEDIAPVRIDADGTQLPGAYPVNERFSGGFCVIDVPSRDDAVAWAARLAAGCRVAQEVWAFMPDPEI